MTQEDKDLLLKDLCARLPYGVVVNYNGLARPLFGIEPTQHFQITLDNALDGEHNGLVYVSLDVDGEYPKPHLRPMSSMTEEEKEEFNTLFNGSFQYFNQGVISDSRKWDKNEAVFVGELDCSKLIDWLNAHYFDYRGLILKGLAIEVTDENNPYKD